MIGRQSWRLLNQDGDLDDIGWMDDQRPKLWRYNQHYFDDLNAESASKRQVWHAEIIERWILENPPAAGCGWDPYPVSLRIVNWVKWALAGHELSAAVTHSLAIQARWLERRLEWHLLGNHLFANAKALVHVGLFFEGPEADRWVSKGMSILAREVREQILDDGAQFEGSPMYHAIAVEDLLDLLNICSINASRLSSHQRSQVSRWRDIIPDMLQWLAAMSHPDGDISFFNDAAFGVAPSNFELRSYANRLGFPDCAPRSGVTNFETSGMVRMQQDDAVVIADLAPIGPSYLPGHAHADTLSFEMSVNNHRVFVNSGTSEYGLGAERLRQRSTSAHNTVCVENKNSSEVWSGFRVGDRASIVQRSVVQEGLTLQVSATHDGYKKNSQGLLHKRSFSLDHKRLAIVDEITSAVDAEARFHLHPKVSLTFSDGGSGEIVVAPDHVIEWAVAGADVVELVDTTWHPKFGVVTPSKCLVARFNGCRCELTLSWI